MRRRPSRVRDKLHGLRSSNPERFLGNAPRREVGTIPWYGPQYSLDDMLVYTMYGHKREHGPQLDAVLERSAG